MTYQISYMSPVNEVKKLADAFIPLLPQGTAVVPLEEADAESQVHLVGFELTSGCRRGIPEAVSEYLRKLSGKTIFVFVTVPFEVTDLVRHEMCRYVVEVLPRECDYVGTYVCSSHPSDHLVDALQNYVEDNPENSRAKHWLSRVEYASGRPDEMDIQASCRFMSHVLKLKENT